MDGVLIKIAFRNLRQHMTKTLIVGVLITLGIAILVVGNSFMDTVKDGIEKNYIENYTGNIFIAPTAVENPSLIMSEGLMEEAPKTVPDFNLVQEYIESLPAVTGTTGQINGAATVKWGELGQGFMLMFGVSSQSYLDLFPKGVHIIDGEFLAEGEEGIVLSATVAGMLNDSAGGEIQPGDTILLTSVNAVSGTKIREVTVKGIHDYDDASFDLSMVCFIDENNLRVINGMLLNTAEDINLTDAEKSSLGELSDDVLFGDGGEASDNMFGDSLVMDINTVSENGTTSGEKDWLNILGDTSGRGFLNETDPTAWSYLLVKIDDSSRESKVIKEINTYFEDNGIEARAYKWIDGAGMSAQMADTISLVFNILIFIIAIVAVIIIMNTLVLSVSERYGEIGTMRAIGARKWFVRKMISLETLMITVVFGLVGVVIGIITLLILRGVGIEASNDFIQILLGGGVFRPLISWKAIVTSVAAVSVVGIIASLYPVSVALKISPLEAMNKG
jgi:ABC-type lipoprotein release transport system permease subunit